MTKLENERLPVISTIHYNVSYLLVDYLYSFFNYLNEIANFVTEKFIRQWIFYIFK